MTRGASASSRNTPHATTILAVSVAAIAVAALAGTAPKPFETQIRPVLQRYCVSCHDAKVRAGGLDLASIRTAAGLKMRPSEYTTIDGRAASWAPGAMSPPSLVTFRSSPAAGGDAETCGDGPVNDDGALDGTEVRGDVAAEHAATTNTRASRSGEARIAVRTLHGPRRFP